MSNTHRLEKLRFAEAPDGTTIWVKTPLHNSKWVLAYAVSWSSKCRYVVNDGFFVEERKAFAEGKTVQYKLINRDYWTEVDKDHRWDKHFQYCIKPKEWHELEENIGKFILVNNIDNKEEAMTALKFAKYVEGEPCPFKTVIGNMYKYAWLIDPEELAKEK